MTPLVHFWGIHPQNEAKLQQAMVKEGNLTYSTKVRDLLARYATLVPMSNQQFNEHFAEVHPGKTGSGCPASHSPLYGCGWYRTWKDKWSETDGKAAVAAVQALLTKYYT